METVSEDNLRLFFKLKSPFVEFFVNKLLDQEVYSVDFVFGDNGTLNWLVSDKNGWLFKFQRQCQLLREAMKGLKGSVTVASQKTMR